MDDPRVLSAASRALGHLEAKQQIWAHNLANASTHGFRGDRVFARLAADALGPETLQAMDVRPGPMEITERPLDLALEGPGFLVVEDGGRERLIRGGSLRVDRTGLLVDGSHRPVLGAEGRIVLPPGEVTVDSDGRVHVDAAFIDRLRVEGSPEGTELRREGGGLYAVLPDGATAPSPETRVRQGMLEGSNVEPIQAMTEMIEIQRSFASIQRAVHVLDGVLERVTNDLGRVR